MISTKNGCSGRLGTPTLLGSVPAFGALFAFLTAPLGSPGAGAESEAWPDAEAGSGATIGVPAPIPACATEGGLGSAAGGGPVSILMNLMLRVGTDDSSTSVFLAISANSWLRLACNSVARSCWPGASPPGTLNSPVVGLNIDVILSGAGLTTKTKCSTPGCSSISRAMDDSGSTLT